MEGFQMSKIRIQHIGTPTHGREIVFTAGQAARISVIGSSWTNLCIEEDEDAPLTYWILKVVECGEVTPEQNLERARWLHYSLKCVQHWQDVWLHYDALRRASITGI